jgi:hypothetical protein
MPRSASRPAGLNGCVKLGLIVGMVATGRHMEPDAVRGLADGRAYTGRQALKPLFHAERAPGRVASSGFVERPASPSASCGHQGAVIRCRPVGALVMKDQAGPDEKVLAVPVDELHPFYTGIRSYRDLPSILCQQIAHFFQHYKDLEKGKWTQLDDWIDVAATKHLIVGAIKRAKDHAKNHDDAPVQSVQAAPAATGTKTRTGAGKRLKTSTRP